MKRIILIAVVIPLIMTRCTTKKETTENTPVTLDSLLHQYYEERLKLFPLEATMTGDDRYNDLLPNDMTFEYRKKVTDFFIHYRDTLVKIERSRLSENDQMSYDVLLWDCDIAIEGSKFKDYFLPLNQMGSMALFIGQDAGGTSVQPFKTVKDYDNWLSRLDSYTVWCDSAIVNMKNGMNHGYILPTKLIEKVIPQISAFDHGPAKDHLFYSPIKNIPLDFSSSDRDRLAKAYEDIIQSKIIPAHKKLREFLETEYLAGGRTTSGIDAIPEGRKYYDYLIKMHTTTTKSADEIFSLGQSEVNRISKEMEAIKDQVGFKGDLKSFFNHLRKKKELMPFKKPEEVIANFNAIHEKMKPNLIKLFDKKPKTPFEVRRTEAFREATASAEYSSGSHDGTRPGVFYVPIPNVLEYNMLSDEDLFLHEAIPGHHYQISLQQENTTLPEFRKIPNYGSYVEGWALYTESLGKELGLYDDPYQYFGMLSGEMHRAIRLVVDAGIHTQGWTREQAIQYSLDHEAETEQSIVAEIERYMAIPGQALSYKIGQLKIRELRTKAEKELGDKFDIAQFHNQVLDSGSIPLKILEDKINRWIETVKKS
ncbi:MAG: DUF885 domain-containing protein [Cyclobacteriaceae bacterium]|nr:DUF885 domain-containing protein [Cyclobacteriaceae bacterium]